MSEWTTSRLRDHVEIVLGFAFKSEHFSLDPDGPRLLRGDNVKRGSLEWGTSTRYWPAPESEVLTRYSLYAGDVVVGMDGSRVGENFAVIMERDLPALLVQRVACLRARNSLDQRFLRYLVCNPAFTAYVKEIHTGTSIPHISGEQIGAFPVLLPPVSEQRAIAEVLGAIDDKVEANRGTVRVAEALARSLASQPTASLTIGDIAAIRRQMVSPTPWAGDVQHFSLPAFDRGAIPGVESAESIKSGKFLLQGPAVLVSKLNPHIPRVWMASPSRTCPAVTSTEFVILEPLASLDVEVLWALCSAPQFSAQLNENVKGTTGSHQRVAPEDVLTLEVPDPSSLDAAAVATITYTVRLATRLREESQSLATLRDTLLPKLLSGELRVRDANAMVG